VFGKPLAEGRRLAAFRRPGRKTDRAWRFVFFEAILVKARNLRRKWRKRQRDPCGAPQLSGDAIGVAL
jgi:hypothetical protein